MPEATRTEDQGKEPRENSFQIAPPAIALPKGGGAIRGMGEKFGVNPVTGTGSLTIPIYTSAGRAGFGPQLMLSYDSGGGNGPFGLGWSLSLPSITRKTDKGLPRYVDAEDSDVFILSGAEDLVPSLIEQDHAWAPDSVPPRTIGTVTYDIRRYRPRIEGLFARIERWTNQDDDTDVFWRSISKDNVTTWYGKTPESRIFDPADPSHIFRWLMCESLDDKGQAIVYAYKPDDSDGIASGLAREKNRTTAIRGTNRYLKRIKYGNQRSRLVEPDLDQAQWLFEVVFDYGEHDWDGPQSLVEPKKWDCRQDPFSTYRAGFEVRTYRLCRRVLMFHHFPDEDIGADCLVRSTNFTYSHEQQADDSRNPMYSFIESVEQVAYQRNQEGTYDRRSFPPVTFEYAAAEVSETIRDVDPASVENLPSGLEGGHYQWVDLDGEGLSGILTEQATGWFYKRNLSPATEREVNGGKITEVRLAPVELVASKPSLAALRAGGQQLLDLAGDGQLDLVSLQGPVQGFYERTVDEQWETFKPFQSIPNRNWSDPNLKFIDLTGDGHADVMITEDEVLCWHPSLAEEGFGPASYVRQANDEEAGPRLVFADGTQSIFLADMSGDGLIDLVRIRNGDICYWPNLGYGRFGAKVTMDQAPWFEAPDLFDPRRIRLADIDGSGTTDILYLSGQGVHLYFNQSGNGWAVRRSLKAFPPIDNLAGIMTADLLGNGTACLVWSSPLPGNARQPMRYVDLMGGRKPHVMIRTANNLGAETHIQYAPSTKFYVADRLAGRPWITKIPFPVHCVEKVTITDKWRRTTFSSTYSYHHGYFDGIEREFRGFGRVEQIDIEDYGIFADGNTDSPYITDAKDLYQPPVKTVTWFHTGAFLDRKTILTHFQDEYFPGWFEALRPGEANVFGGFQENKLPEPDLITQDLSAEEWREALRACKGMVLRREIYELDVDKLVGGAHEPVKLFSTAYHNCHVRRLQPRQGNPHAVFLVTESESITYHYEMDLTTDSVTPDPRISHTLKLRIDEFGNVQQTVVAVYPRFGRHRDASLPNGTEDLIAAVQQEPHLLYTERCYTSDAQGQDDYRLRLPCEVSRYVLTGITPLNGRYFTLGELRNYRLSPRHYQVDPVPGDIEVAEIPYHQVADGTSIQKRLVERLRTLFFERNLTTFLPLGELNSLALKYEDYKLALTDDLLDAVFGATLMQSARHDLDDPAVGGYISGQALSARFPNETTDGEYWIRSGTARFSNDAAEHFYLPERYVDPFGHVTTLLFDQTYDLFIKSSTDALGNTAAVESFDYRVLAPSVLKDMNDNLTEMRYDIRGLPAVMAMKGKGNQGDSLDGITPAVLNPSLDQISNYFQGAFDSTEVRRLLGNATARYVYHLGEERQGTQSVFAAHPPAAGTILRERHVAHLGRHEESRLQVAFEYSDGLGALLVKKSQAEPAEGSAVLRWIASGKTVLNNKGKPVKRYEPYFSTNEHRFDETEAEAEIGVTPIMYYDAMGRLIRTELPDGAFSRVEFSPWHVTSFDPCDTAYDPTGNAHSDWYKRRTDPGHRRFAEFNSAGDRRAADLVKAHALTPAQVMFDGVGREAVAVSHNTYVYPDNGPSGDERYVTFTKLDPEGKPLWIRDANRHLVMQYITPPKPTRWSEQPDETVPADAVPCYDVAGNLLHQHSMDAGDRWTLNDAAGEPLYAWDLNGRRESDGTVVVENRVFQTKYDALHRPSERWLTINGGAPQLIERFVYGETSANAKQDNVRGRLREHFDQSGRKTAEAYDFKGNVLTATRQLAGKYREPVIGWQPGSPTAVLDPQSFVQQTEYDALNRITRLYNWHRGTGGPVAVYEPTYHERGTLQREELVIRGLKTADGYQEPAQSRRTAVIAGVTYNARGQRERIEYGNGTTTRYEYDPETFRLAQLRTTRPAYDPTFPSRRSQFKNDRVLQNLFYTYDPMGNLTEVEDDAYEPAFFANQQVDPRSRYVYDALYRLIAATARQNGALRGVPADSEPGAVGLSFPIQLGDPNALSVYRQIYRYDAVGNIERLRHEAGLGSWTRDYAYAFEDPAQPASNRLWQTWEGGDRTQAVSYTYDAHGSMQNLINVTPAQYIRWDYRDMIRELDLGGGGRAYYNYDSGKQRSRKVIESRTGTKQWERMDFGGFELYRRYVAGNVVEEIETHHVMDGSRRIMLVEDVLWTDHPRIPEGPLYRYQYGNHLGSACLELNDASEVISYEEYHPYGTSAYRATNGALEVPAKRYRYTGMERDEESGLNYHGARYYAVWLGRWVSADPFSLIDGENLIGYALANPIGRVDTSGLASTEEVTEFDSDKLVEQFSALPNVTPDWIDAYEKFNETVKNNLLKEPTPTTAREKSMDVDIENEAHDRAVVTIVNAAIDAASALVKAKGIEVSEHDLLKMALQMVVYPYRTSHDLTENVILRDVDHFLTGRIQAWRDFAPRTPLFDVATLGKGATNDPGIILLGNYAAIVYDERKRQSFRVHPKPDEKHARNSMDQDSKPASAPGGRFWAYLGGELLKTRDHPSESADASKLKISYEDVKGARSTWPTMKAAFELSYGLAKQEAARTIQQVNDTIEELGDTLRFIGERMHD
ncbi:MAG: SpvB/TcaC N-terminal domain-containing protein [Nitrospira sp.]|nr:SpvB/TcaC N-terminal domain-containing protein [Nitrospira sp.]